MNIIARVRTWIVAGFCLLAAGACVVGGETPTTCTTDTDCQPGTICVGTVCIQSSTETKPAETVTPDALPDQQTPDIPGPDAAPDTTPDAEPDTTPDDTTTCIDKDKDGYCENIPGTKGELDCDDNDKNVYPGQPELCDGKDNDCSGTPDDNLRDAPLCPKQDGVCKGSQSQSCNGASGWKPCDTATYQDHNSSYEATEASCDNKDNDCNGQVDESFDEKGQTCIASGQRGECARGTYTSCTRGNLICTATTKAIPEVCNNGKDDDCDGRTDETPPCTCIPGKSEACYNLPSGCTRSGSNYNCKGTCKAGTRTCQADNTWGACQGAVEPASETCDGKDNDCDGNVDETYPERNKPCTDTTKQGECGKGIYKSCTQGKLVCSITTTPKREECNNTKDDDCDGSVDETDCSVTYPSTSGISDYAARSDGTTLVVHGLSSTSFRLTCFDANAKAQTTVVTISAPTGGRVENPSISTAPNSTDVSVVSWVERSTSSSSTRRIYSQLYDSKCKALTPAKIPWPAPANSALDVHDTAVDGSGNVAAVYYKANEVFLVFYNKSGALLKAEQPLDPAKRYCSNSYGLQVAMNASGVGVVSCQRHASDPIVFRRFGTNRNFQGTAVTIVAASQNNSQSSYSRSHAININDQGIVAIQWQKYDTRNDQAVYYSTTNTVLKQFPLGTNAGSATEGFRYQGQRVERIGNDFVFRDSNTSSSGPKRWYRYDVSGKLIASAISNFRSYLTRTTNNYIFASDNSRIYRGELDLSTGKGVCSGKPCVCTPNETRACYEGGTSARVPCKNGTETCASDGLSWGTCLGETLPTPEICGNSKDDDCDGKSDENCPLTDAVQPIGFSDMAVANDGSIVVIHFNNKILYGTCFSPTGTVTKSFFKISKSNRYVSYPSLRMAPDTKRFIVSWFDQATSSNTLGYFTSMLYNGSCTSISQPIRWTTKPINRPRSYDFAIDSSGRFVTVHNDSTAGAAQLNFYNANGVAVRLGVKPYNNECNTSSGIRVALHLSSGNGLFTCEKFSSGPIHYRRFNLSGTFLDPGPVLVAGSESGRASYYNGHIIGINSKSDFAIQWQSRTDATFYANTYASNGALRKQLKLTQRMRNTTYAFNSAHQQVELFGDDFIFRDGGTSLTPNWYRYTPQGVLVSAHLGDTSLDRYTLRVAGGKTYIYTGGLIAIDKVNLQAGVGLCGGQICLCKANTTRSCYSGSTGTPRTPCKAGTQTCASNGLSWSSCSGQVLPAIETCGNAVDDDCDGKVDDNCPRTTKIDIGGTPNDFDVANDGSIVAIRWTGTGLLGYCIAPNLLPKGKPFSISTFGRTVGEAQVRIAKSSKHFLVLWRDAEASTALGTLTARLYDANCSPVTSQFVVYNVDIPHYEYDFAIDDNGNSVIIWKDDTRLKAYIAFFDNKGIRQGGQTEINPNGQYCRSSYGMHVAINPANRAGVVTCQQHRSNPIYYRRFGTNRSLAGNEMVIVPNTSPNASSYSRSHVVGMNRKGEMVIYWQNYYKPRYEGVFYSATGGLLKHLLGSTTMSRFYNSFQVQRENVELFGDDFILRDGGSVNSNVTWYRYTPTGTTGTNANVTSTTYKRHTLRVGNGKLHIIKDGLIEVGTLVLR